MREHDLNALYRGSSMVVEPEPKSSESEVDDCLMLMSMALDGLLDHDERTRLESRIAADPALDEMWQQWCKVDVAFVETPRQLPVVGFTNRFEARLEQKLTRERTRQRVIMAAVATVVWTAVLVIAGVLLWFLLMNQGELMGAVARETAYYGRAIGIGIGALQTTASATFSAPQSMVIALAYAVATAGLLYVWVRFLRRTTYESGMYQSGIESGNEEM
jgi:anti-sigma factor RsiW